MIEKIKTLLSEIEQLKASDANELEAARIRYLSKKKVLSQLLWTISVQYRPIRSVKWACALTN